MTPSSETEIFLGVVPMGKLQPRVQWSFVPSTKIAITKQKIDFWPQISKFWGQKSTFSPLAANWSLADQCLQHEKGVSLESRYEGTKIFTPCPQKIGFQAQKRPNLAKTWHFGPNIGIFCPFYLMPDQKTMRTSCVCGFLRYACPPVGQLDGRARAKKIVLFFRLESFGAILHDYSCTINRSIFLLNREHQMLPDIRPYFDKTL